MTRTWARPVVARATAWLTALGDRGLPVPERAATGRRASRRRAAGVLLDPRRWAAERQLQPARRLEDRDRDRRGRGHHQLPARRVRFPRPPGADRRGRRVRRLRSAGLLNDELGEDLAVGGRPRARRCSQGAACGWPLFRWGRI